MFCFSLVSFAKVRIAYVDVPPYSYQDINNRAQGQLIEKFREIMYFMEEEVVFIYLPHRRLIDFIELGEVDIWAGLDKSQVNNELSLVSNTPLFVMEMQVYWKSGTKSVDRFEDLHNKDLIMVSSYSYGGNYSRLAKESSNVSYVINHEDGFDQLFSGNNKYFLGYERISQEVIKKFDITDFQETTLAKYTLYLKLSKTYPNATEMMKKIDAFLLAQMPNNN